VWKVEGEYLFNSTLKVKIKLTRFVKHRNCGVVEKSHVLGLFKNVQMQGAQKSEPRGVYLNTLSGAVCRATQQMSVFQQRLSF
jgi:hypothetical protein